MLKYIFDTNKFGRKYSKLILIGIIILTIAIVLSLLLPYSIKKNPLLTAFGFISFAITGVLVIVIFVISGLMTTRHLCKKHSGIWEKTRSRSLSTRTEALKQIRAINDPYLKKVSCWSTRIGVFCFVIWFVLLVVVSCIDFIMGDISFIEILLGKLLN